MTERQRVRAKLNDSIVAIEDDPIIKKLLQCQSPWVHGQEMRWATVTLNLQVFRLLIQCIRWLIVSHSPISIFSFALIWIFIGLLPKAHCCPHIDKKINEEFASRTSNCYDSIVWLFFILRFLFDLLLNALMLFNSHIEITSTTQWLSIKWLVYYLHCFGGFTSDSLPISTQRIANVW